jgi:hypothetical protein
MAFDAFLKSERQRALYEKSRGRWTHDEDSSQNTILKDELDGEEWEILKQYVKLLLPCFEATMELQGQPGDGKKCGLANVQLDIEWITHELNLALERYKHASAMAVEGQWHFATQIRLALDKAEEYYAKLDASPAYIAATTFHPAYTWRFIESHWSNRKRWVDSSKKAVRSLWTSTYKQHSTLENMSPQKVHTQELTGPEAYRTRGLNTARGKSRRALIEDEFDRYYANQTQVETDRPLEWWRTYGVKEYPRLAQMALDILSIPAMSDEPERVFSRLGLMITKRRNRLDHSIIQAANCLHSWDRADIIDLRKEFVQI